MKIFFRGRNKSLAQVALSWVLAQPVVSAAIVGATSTAQLEESLPGVEVRLDEEEMEFLNGLWFDLPRMSDPSIALR
jgi:aryl-alcohol dehydrogenase-like predicted oxidoreductase